MTPRKNIVRNPVHTFPDGSPLPCLGPEFTSREGAFISWYTNPGTEAFLNAGRAAIRAGYKPDNAVAQGYLLKRKPRISEAIKKALPSVEENLHAAIWHIWYLAKIRMFFDIADFYKAVRVRKKTGGAEIEATDFEAASLDSMTWEQRMCIDGIDLKGPDGSWVQYKLPDREKECKLFLECSMLLFPEEFESDELLQALAAVYKVKVRAGLKGTAAYLRERPSSPLYLV